MNKIEKQDQQKPYAGYSEEADRHWAEVMALAEKYGFIIQAYAGTAILISAGSHPLCSRAACALPRHRWTRSSTT